jgi:hypothetical protein
MKMGRLYDRPLINKIKEIMKTYQFVTVTKLPFPFLSQQRNENRSAVRRPGRLQTANVAVKARKTWLDKDAPQNLSGREAAIRGLLVVILPPLSGIDWYYGTSFIMLLSPLLFYLEVTALTKTCPVKHLFSQSRFKGSSKQAV